MASSYYVQKLFADIAKRYEIVNHILCLGLDYWWRYKVAKKIKQCQPSNLLDVATGTGNLATAVKKASPKTTIIGLDFCRPILEEAQDKGIDLLIEADGLELPFADDSFDSVTIAFGLRNMESWPEGIRSLQRVLRPHGKLFILDFSLPTHPCIKPFYRFYLHHILPHVAGWVTGNPDAYEYLGASIEAFPSGEEMCALLEKNGLKNAQATPMSLGIVTFYEGEKAA